MWRSLGGLHDAQAALRRRMPRQLRLVISCALDSFPAAQRLPPDEYAGDARGEAVAAGGGQEISVPPPVAATAAALLEHVLAMLHAGGWGMWHWWLRRRITGAASVLTPPTCAVALTALCARPLPCPQVFQQFTQLLHLLSLARVPKASSGLELLLRKRHHQHHQHHQQLAGGEAGAAGAAPRLPLTGPPSAEATRAEVNAAWECLQLECQRLLADILGAAPRRRHTAVRIRATCRWRAGWPLSAASWMPWMRRARQRQQQ